ncbi:hypothetical protein IT087_00760 [Candidatus Uhrbacteria bacterium]|nr:hypothetical protein [Candidatus Uhrbacteria bacterium]
MSRNSRHASRFLFIGLVFLFTFAFLPTQEAEAAKTCKFACLGPDGGLYDAPDVGLSSLTCDDDSDCLARCTASCGEPAAARRVCATSPAPTCEENAEPAADAEPEVPPPPTRTPGEFGYRNPLGSVSINQLLGRIIRTVLGFVGALFLLMFVYGGATWMLAGGDAKKVQSGQRIFLNAIIGMVIVAISYSIISLLFETASVIRGG